MSTHTTALGTPCARTWSDEWIATVDAAETQLNHRICGARLHVATPCLQTSNHPSGRCRFHGGFDLTGAPKGNRNHVIHGLYSRRLRTCSQSCLHWHTCPCANANHDPSYRSDPTDPSYSPSTPSTDLLWRGPDPATPRDRSPLRTFSDSSQPDPPCPPNANILNAFFRLLRDFRATLKLLHGPAHGPLNRQKHGYTHPTPEGILRHAQRIQHDANIDPDAIADVQLEPQTPQTHAKAFFHQAALAGGEGHEVEMYWTFDNATMLDEPYADTECDAVLGCYRPTNQTVTEDIAAQILGHMHFAPFPEPEDLPRLVTDPITDEMRHQDAQSKRDYMDLFYNGKIPPEAFPLNTPLRTLAEAIYQGKPHSHLLPQQESATATTEAESRD